MRKVGTSGGAAVAAAQMNRPPDSKGFRQPIRDTAVSRFGGGENGKGADTAEERMEPEPIRRKVRASREPIRRKEEWWKDRFGGRKNGGRADSAEGRMVEEPIQRVC